ncbi:uncharacterized protein LOC122064085 isoform X2 [Macadamia integrifolia]|uniref:uncharacterized protein LOC122064085 isoform X2 n=1 Tax=Macadamia integrifolia TaxID=60698 RepID=UPI001C4E509B|nr:uncharacterized protein LOC122064085 isoform X2 [Macadamia integrifolia]
MAMKSSSPPAIIQFSPVRASTKSRVFMHHNSGSPAQKPRSVQIIKYSPTNKVFEDQSRGIVCYRDDDSGEIICEGFDEGPRPCLQTHTPAYYVRQLGIVDLLLLHQNCFQIVTDV